MAKAKKTQKPKLEDLDFMDGKAAPDTKGNVTTIDEILGATVGNPFRVKTLEELEYKIDKEMNLADMQALATKVGLLPVSERHLLRKRLVDEFKRDLRRRTPYKFTSIAAKENMKLDMSSKVKKILGEGA